MSELYRTLHDSWFTRNSRNGEFKNYFQSLTMKKPHKNNRGSRYNNLQGLESNKRSKKYFTIFLQLFNPNKLNSFYRNCLVAQINFISYFWSKNPILHLTSTMEQCKFARNMVKHMLSRRDLAEFVYCSLT